MKIFYKKGFAKHVLHETVFSATEADLFAVAVKKIPALYDIGHANAVIAGKGDVTGKR